MAPLKILEDLLRFLVKVNSRFATADSYLFQSYRPSNHPSRYSATPRESPMGYLNRVCFWPYSECRLFFFFILARPLLPGLGSWAVSRVMGTTNQVGRIKPPFRNEDSHVAYAALVQLYYSTQSDILMSSGRYTLRPTGVSIKEFNVLLLTRQRWQYMKLCSTDDGKRTPIDYYEFEYTYGLEFSNDLWRRLQLFFYQRWHENIFRGSCEPN